MALAERYAANGRFPRLFTVMGELGKPIICAAGGHVLAGALGLALACDLVIASERATFGAPEINVGLFPFMIAALIGRNVGRKKMTELLLLGERIDAAEALRLGIVNRVVAPRRARRGRRRLGGEARREVAAAAQARQGRAVRAAGPRAARRARVRPRAAGHRAVHRGRARGDRRVPRAAGTAVERQIAALLCRTSERGEDAAAGTRELAELLGARIIGSPGEPHAGRPSRRPARRARLPARGRRPDRRRARGRARPDPARRRMLGLRRRRCPSSSRHRPDVRVLWLDAHPDFNTPDTSASGYLGGMCLAGACGLWDTGFGAGLDPGRVIMFGVRDVDGLERVALDRCGVHRLGEPAQLQGMELFVHVDLDVLDPGVSPGELPGAARAAAGGAAGGPRLRRRRGDAGRRGGHGGGAGLCAGGGRRARAAAGVVSRVAPGQPRVSPP